MKAVMRLDKTQVRSNLTKLTTAGTAVTDTFKPHVLVAAGYTDFDIVMVGAVGGKSGIARSKGGTSGTYRLYACGGGGGGSLRLTGKLKDLDPVIPMSVGVPGANGADGTLDGRSGDGAAGGDAVFGPHIAYGGKGGTGGDFTSTVYTPPSVNVDKVDVTVRPAGGNGGGNTSNLGVVGTGGKIRMYEIPSSGVPVETAQVSSIQGTWVAGGVAPVVGGGAGGGGGYGQCYANGNVEGTSQDGAQGGYVAMLTEGGVRSTTDGGSGGGANVKAVSGILPNDCYGGGPATYNKPEGVIAIKLS